MPVHILVVDDEPQMERLIRQRFRKRVKDGELDFVFASNGQEALDLIRDGRSFDVVFTDINMPKMDGLTFISKLQDVLPLQKTVMISAYGDMKNIRTAMNMGAYDFIIKPIDFRDLEITLDKAIKEIEMLKLAESIRRRLDALQKELLAANEVQQSIIPTKFSIFSPQSPYELFAKMIPAKEVGGDFYDFFKIDDHHLSLVIGDVSGKGMPASLLMAVSRTLIRTIGLKERSCSECLEKVNYLLSLDNPSHLFVTLFYGLLNLNTGVLEYVNAGHNPLYVVNEEHEVRMLEYGVNVPLGMVEEGRFDAFNTRLAPGEALIMYTDGVTEAQNRSKEFYHERRLLEHLKNAGHQSACEMVKGLIREVTHFGEDSPQSDDITLMVLKRKK